MAPEKVAMIYCKAIDAINSCQSLEQLNMAANYSNRALKMLRQKSTHRSIIMRLESDVAFALQTMGITLNRQDTQRKEQRYGHGNDERVCAT